MVLQAVWDDMQLLLSLPLTPLTYHVLAEADELIRHRAMSSNVVVKAVCFTLSPLPRRVAGAGLAPCPPAVNPPGKTVCLRLL